MSPGPIVLASLASFSLTQPNKDLTPNSNLNSLDERFIISKVEEEVEAEEAEDTIEQKKDNVKVLYLNEQSPPPIEGFAHEVDCSYHSGDDENFQPVRESDNEYVSSNAD